jgi:hypothetical protein
MGKESDKQGSMGVPSSLKDEVGKAVGEGRSDFVWVRSDGAVCFGDECVVISRNEKQDLDITVKPDRCGTDAGEAILDHIIRTAGRGVNIKVPPIDRD